MSEAMRDAFGKKLAELGAVNKNLVVLDADVSSSTKSSIFGKAYPDRFFNCGVSEGNMAGVAAGLAAGGFHPVINTFSIFITLKCLDQIRHDFCYNKLPVVVAAAYGGFSDSFDGASHQTIEDISIMRSLPNMEVIVPGDAAQAGLALEYALSKTTPVFIRLNRNAFPNLSDSSGFTEKKPILLQSGKNLSIAANGITIHAALEAAKILEKEGVTSDVFSTPFVKPFNPGPLLDSVKKTGKLITVEEHSILGGAGSAAVEQLTQKGIAFTWKPIGVKDVFGDTGPYNELLKAYKLDAESIAEEGRNFAKN
ncbi:MAG: 1-deoxy-D-xylulose-5-phosphate synthase [Spirochaetaceae bacterium]|jgi:transketolase|nr:1-deoxy-D-xylulose-5-phosphate synthase [Spirochaetaceae bacterium]